MNKTSYTYHCHFAAGLAWSNSQGPTDAHRRLERLTTDVTEKCRPPATAVPNNVPCPDEGTRVGMTWRWSKHLTVGLVMEYSPVYGWEPVAGGVGIDINGLFIVEPPHGGNCSAVVTSRCMDLKYGPRQLLEAISAMFPGVSQADAARMMDEAGLTSEPAAGDDGSFAASWGADYREEGGDDRGN